MKRNLITSALAVLVFTVLLGLVYPLVVTGIAQVAFGAKADGDPTLIARDTKNDPRYFQPRPSQTEYNAERDLLLQPRAQPGQRASSSTASRSRPTRSSTARPAMPPIRRRHHVRLGRRPAHLRGQRRDPGAPRRARARPPARARRAARRGEHRRALPRRARRAGREHHQAQRGTRPMTALAVPSRARVASTPRRVEVPVHAGHPVAGDRGVVQEARPARAGPQPGHVRGRDRRADHHDRVDRSATAATRAGSRSRSRSGCG